MAIRARPIEPNDLRGCVDIIADHPLLRRRYQAILPDLPAVLLALMRREAFSGTVFEEVNDTSTHLLGAGIATFVKDDFMRQVKTSPITWATPELAFRLKEDGYPVLSDQELRTANSEGGLNLFVWHSGLGVDDVGRSDVAGTVITTFFDQYRGYRIKDFCQMAETWQHFLVARAAGCYVVCPSNGSYFDRLEVIEGDIERVPVTVGMNCELASQTPGSWVGAALFRYEPPRFSFTRGQQRLLKAALTGATDEDLARELGISYFTVKKFWREIYDRSSPFFPEWRADHEQKEVLTQYRGRQKRHHLVAYLREHPEEMRPITQKRDLRRSDFGQ